MRSRGCSHLSSPRAACRSRDRSAFENRKHVYLEKPLATNIEDAKRVQFWRGRKAKAVGMIGFNYRFNSHYAEIRRCIESRELGELVSARSVFSSSDRNLAPWKQRRVTGGGVLLDLASHHIDLARFLFGQDVAEVLAQVWSQKSEGDSAFLELRLANGLKVQSFFSLCSIGEDSFKISAATKNFHLIVIVR